LESETPNAETEYISVVQPDFEDVARAVDPQRHQLERRSEARRKKVLRRHPDTGPFILAMSDEPTAETAFDQGEPWQRWVAELVRDAFPEGVFLFNRRRGPNAAGDIDIVAIVPSGIWAVDIQRHEGRVEVRQGKTAEGRRDFLVVDGVDRTNLLDDVDDQAAAVSTALRNSGFHGPRATSVLCLIDALPAWRAHAQLGATYVTKARPMLKLLAGGPKVLDDTDIASLGLTLDRALARRHLTT
jgi:hypothetical protein